MKTINEAQLESDVTYRYEFLAEVMEFTTQDVDAIHQAAPLLAPHVPGLVDAVYDKLFSFDATKRHFVARQSGYGGPLPKNIQELDTNHEMIQFRKNHLAKYLTSLVTRPYDDGMVRYLDAVGRVHTPAMGSPDLSVPLVQMNALMGFVSDAIVNAVFGLELTPDVQARTVRAFNKLLWIQNDLIARHYVS